MLQFLNPSILIGLLAAAIPLIIHFLNRQKIKEQPFSTVHFLKKLEPRQIRRLQFRQWLLLLIRTLMIVFLVLAFARPTIREGALAAIGERSAVAATVIVDNSQSMDESTLTGSLHEALRHRFLNLGELFQGNDWVSVVQSTRPIKILLKGELFNRERWSQVHKELQPTVLHTDMENAVNIAVGKLQQQPQFRKEVYILSDFQKSIAFDPQAVQLPIENPEQWHFFLIPLPHYASDNLSVDSVEVVNRLLERNQPLRIRARVVNHSPQQTLTSLVALIINGKRVGQRNISFNPGESRWVDFETVLLDAGWVTGQVELESDILLSDNVRYFTFYTPPKITVIHLTPPESAHTLLPLVLKPALESGYFEYQQVNPEAFLSLAPQPNTVVVVENINTFPPVLLETLRRFLKAGSGVILFAPEGEPGNLETLFRSWNLGRFQGVWGDPQNHAQFKRIQTLRFTHALFEGLFEKNATRLNPIEVYAGIQWIPGQRSSIPIAFPDGTPFTTITPVENGMVGVVAAPLSPQYTELPFRGFVVPFVYRLLFYSATARNQTGKPIRTGQSWQATYYQLKAPLQFTIQTPGGSQVKVQPRFRQEQVVLQFNGTTETGIYTVLKGDNLLGKFAVNPWPEESDFTMANLENWQAALPNSAVLNPQNDLAAQITALRSGREIWKWFFLMAILLAMLEMLLAWTGQRKQQDVELEPIRT